MGSGKKKQSEDTVCYNSETNISGDSPVPRLRPQVQKSPVSGKGWNSREKESY
jgi:hypothetical protein